MDAYIYAADIFCADCGKQIRSRITAEGHAPANPKDETTYDSDEFPKGPYPDGGGEADSVQHCGSGVDCVNAIELGDGTKIGCMLENPLTTDGVQTVKDAIAENPDCEVVQLWMDHYVGVYLELKRDEMPSNREEQLTDTD